MRPRSPSLLLLCSFALGACQANPVPDEGLAVAALGETPPDVACLRVRARSTAGVAVRDVRVDVTTGSEPEVLMDRLPVGALVFRGDAYTEPCSATLDSLAPTYSSNDVTATTSLSGAVSVPLVLRRTARARVDVEFAEHVEHVSLGHNSTAVFLEDGSEVVLGNVANRDALATLADVREAALQGARTCAIAGTAGEVWCWWGPASVTRMAVPPALEITGGQGRTCVITQDHELWCWGYDHYGELAQPAAGAVNEPTRITHALVSQVVFGQHHTCYRGIGGDLACVGQNSHGQLGNETRTDSRVWQTPNGTYTGFRQIAASGVATFAVREDGTLWGWGYMNPADLPYGDRPRPLALTTGGFSALLPVDAIVAGESYACALHHSRVSCWGRNRYGEIGNPAYADGSRVPVDALLPEPADALFASSTSVCARATSGAAFCWGSNREGMLGTSDWDNRFTPIPLFWD